MNAEDQSGRVAPLCSSWLSFGKATGFSQRRIPTCGNSLHKIRNGLKRLSSTTVRLEEWFSVNAKIRSVISRPLRVSRSWLGELAQLVERRTGTPLRLVRFPAAARNFSPTVNFQCRLSYGVRKTPVCNRVN